MGLAAPGSSCHTRADQVKVVAENAQSASHVHPGQVLTLVTAKLNKPVALSQSLFKVRMDL